MRMTRPTSNPWFFRSRLGCTAIHVALPLFGWTGVHAAESLLLGDATTEIVQALAEFDRAQGIEGRQPDTARQLFRSAARRLEGVAASGIVNGPLEYNLGNAHLRAGDVGRAILHYLRAQKLMPRDPLLQENLSVARSRRLTNLRTTAQSDILRAVLFWQHDTSTAERTQAMIAAYFGFWALLILRNWVPRRWVTISACACAVVAVVIWMSVAYDHWSRRNAPAGVITSMDVAVYKGPASTYQRQFEQPLQAGVEFVLSEQRSGWWNIVLVDGNSGWIEQSRAELVP